MTIVLYISVEEAVIIEENFGHIFLLDSYNHTFLAISGVAESGISYIQSDHAIIAVHKSPPFNYHGLFQDRS